MALDTLTIDTSQLTARVNKLAALAGPAFGQAVAPLVNEALKIGHDEVIRLLSGPVLKRRTGKAAGSVQVVPAQAEGDIVTGSIGSNVRYLHFQFKGGTIVPRNAKWLAIPIGNALTPAGVPRYPSPRDAGKLIFIPRTRAGNAILARRKPGGGLDPLFVLKKSVTIPPHNFLTAPKQTMLLQLKRTLPAVLQRVA